MTAILVWQVLAILLPPLLVIFAFEAWKRFRKNPWKGIIEMTTTVKVFLRGALASPDAIPFWSDYETGDELSEALVFEAPAPVDGDAGPILGQVFEQLNIGGDTEWAKRYRAQGNRSLSVGDVVVIGETAYACDRVGWRSVVLPGRPA